MKLPIPQDWDGESWICVQIQWPDSIYWLALLNNALSEYMKGRQWNEQTGVIVDTQATGREIWERNQALTPCDGEPLPQEILEVIRYVGSCCEPEGEESEMPGCLDLSTLIKIEEGQLWVKDSCCEWISVGSLAGLTEELGDDPLEPDPPVYSACGKAYALSEILFSIGNNAWDEVDNFPWQWIPHIEEDVGLDLDNKWLVTLVNQSVIMTGTGYERAGVLPSTGKDWLRAQIAALLSDDAAGITEDQYNDLRSMMVSHQGIDPFLRNFWTYVFYALGWSKASDVTKLGATDVSEDCSEPDEIIDPTSGWEGLDWSHFWDFRIDEYTSLANNGLTEWVAGQGWVDWADEGTDYVKTDVKIPFVSEVGTLKRVWMRIHVGNGFDYSGDHSKIETANFTIYGPGDPGHDPVDQGGDFNLETTTDHAVDAADNEIQIKGEGHVDGVSGATDPDSWRLIAFAIGGTGTDPFV